MEQILSGVFCPLTAPLIKSLFGPLRFPLRSRSGMHDFRKIL